MNSVNTTHFIDQTSEGQHHMVFNAAFIEILSELFPKNNINYLGVESSQLAVIELISFPVKQKLSLNSINYFNTSTVLKPIKILFFIFKEILRVYYFIKIFLKTNKKDVICLSITTFSSLFLFRFISLFFKRSIFIILHGDIDFLYKATNTYEKINAWTHKLIFKLKTKSLKYIVLNKICKNILVKDKYLNEEELIEINHPYFFDKNTSNNLNSFEKPIIYAHNGSMEVERKNSHFIFEIAKQLKDLIDINHIEFQSIGLATQQIDAYKNQYVKLSVGIKRENLPPYLSREQYEFELKKVNYLLFFFPVDEYVFRASGAVIDAIAFEKPIIVLKHPFFENLFQQGGNIGYICESLAEMKQLIINISSGETVYFEQYQKQVNNLKNLKEKFGIKHIVNDIKEQLSH